MLFKIKPFHPCEKGFIFFMSHNFVVGDGFLHGLSECIWNSPDVEAEVNLPEQMVANKINGEKERFEIRTNG